MRRIATLALAALVAAALLVASPAVAAPGKADAEGSAASVVVRFLDWLLRPVLGLAQSGGESGGTPPAPAGDDPAGDAQDAGPISDPDG
jgi:hypothetical protein